MILRPEPTIGSCHSCMTPADSGQESSPNLREREKSEDRRRFLKRTSAALIGGAVLATGADLFAAKRPPAVGDKWSIHSWGMVIDVEKCIGCGRCVHACKIENNVPEEFFRTWIERYRYFDGEVVVDSPHGGAHGFAGEDDKRVPDKAFFVPKLCNACEKSPCVQVCPVGATFETPDGAVLVDKEYCIGCRYCVQACPYGCRYIHPETKVADKCTFCYHRIHKGQLPACVEACPTGARMFGDLKDKNSEVSRFLRENKTFVLKPHLNTYPKVFYHGIDSEVR